MQCTQRPDAHSCEDFLALELVQLRRALLEVKARLVTGASHVCGGIDVARYAATTFVRKIKSSEKLKKSTR